MKLETKIDKFWQFWQFQQGTLGIKVKEIPSYSWSIHKKIDLGPKNLLAKQAVWVDNVWSSLVMNYRAAQMRIWLTFLQSSLN